jgi:glutathione S-transferase
MVDAALGPWLLRSFVIQSVRKVDLLQGFPKLQRWLQAYR